MTDLDHHGDRELGEGLLDLAVNVRLPRPPDWLRAQLVAALDDLGRYPDPTAATAAVAARHHRPVEQVLLTAGAAEAFGLLARALRPRSAVVVHPQFSEPERALRAVGHVVRRHLLAAPDGFRLDPATVPADADLVVVGNPTNPTSVLHPRAVLLALARPGRVLVVDEAFLDAVPGEAESLAGPGGPRGVVVVRSLTKTWGLAGLRVGYLLGDADLLAAAARQQPPWAVSTPALVAALACSSPAACAEAQAWAVGLGPVRARLAARLAERGLEVATPPRAPFLLVHDPAGRDLRTRLRGRGVAVRRGDTFPGLGPAWFRVAVRDDLAHEQLVDALDDCLAADRG